MTLLEIIKRVRDMSCVSYLIRIKNSENSFSEPSCDKISVTIKSVSKEINYFLAAGALVDINRNASWSASLHYAI